MVWEAGKTMDPLENRLRGKNHPRGFSSIVAAPLTEREARWDWKHKTVWVVEKWEGRKKHRSLVEVCCDSFGTVKTMPSTGTNTNSQRGLTDFGLHRTPSANTVFLRRVLYNLTKMTYHIVKSGWS